MYLSLYAFRHMETQHIQHILKNNNPNYLNSSYLLAVSGGVDSMALLYAMNTLGLHIEVAHINYHLRDEDSNKDQILVETYCQENDIPIHVYEVSEKDEQPNHSIQNWAREVRYRFFHQIMEQRSLDKLMTAHHCNDNLETFIINLSKASGLKGLSGIPKNTDKIVRPFLSFTKNELYEYAKCYNIPFREDYSNQKDDYLRNRIRHHISPELEKTNDSFYKNFNESIKILNDAKDFIEQQINRLIQELSFEKEGQIIFKKVDLRNQTKFAKYEILSRFGFVNEEENQKIFSAETGSRFINSEFTLLVNRNELIIYKEKVNNDDSKIELTPINATNTINLKSFLPTLDVILDWKYDGDQLQFPLHLRRKKVGDIFQPKGMSGKKKVSKFFKDEKLSILAKQNTWLLCDASDTILGIIPLRQDHRYAATDETKNIFHILNQMDDEV